MPIWLWLVADVSVAHLQMGCGAPELLQAIDAYCREAPDERLGCRVATYAFTHCEATPSLELDEQGALYGSIRDPRDSSYAWLMTFERHRRGWRLAEFRYHFDDCDAMGIPPPPRGRLRLADLRRD
jgi:hypothetical protein